MSRGDVRRAQLISPFGTGAMNVVTNGTSLITSGLDYWFESTDGDDASLNDEQEYQIEEWRLQRDLRVRHFRLPPDWRTSGFHGPGVPNTELTVPMQRFPSWNFCPRCNRLQQANLHHYGKTVCNNPEHKTKGSGRAPFTAQVPFVGICDYGHMQDFPWREWVHKSSAPTCEAPMRLRSTGGASLAAQSVECDCGKKRSLSGITQAEPVGSQNYPATFLTSQLSDGDDDFMCQGGMPWHGEDRQRECSRPLRGSLRASSNLYYALVRSSIYLPRSNAQVSEELIQVLSNPPLSTLISLFNDMGAEVTASALRNQHRELLQAFPSDAEVEAGAKALTADQSEEAIGGEPEDDELTDETTFRRPEYRVLREEIRTPYLEIRKANLDKYEASVADSLSRLMLVDKLRETRALYGFNRIFPEADWPMSDRKALLWKTAPAWNESWLPAYVVHGEGLYFELNEARLHAWENQPAVLERVERLVENYEVVQRTRQLKDRDLTPRFVLLHTLAHLLMNQLTFDSGYSSAALRERLYVSGGEDSMAGVLIYTAAGDAEGTMGGLVRMGKPGYFEASLLNALDASRWCSADPVCMEIGNAGQGPDSCNMAACHSCALVPETACEEFNRFLDRGLVVGTISDPSLGFFGR